MENSRKKIQEYLDMLSNVFGRQFRAEFNGLLTTVFDGDNIIFTSAGGLVQNRYQQVETFLGGILYGLKISTYEKASLN